MNNGNYIKVCRSLLNWEWYSNINTKAVFLHCLLKANWKDGRFEGVDIPRGSFATSLSKMSKELGLSERQVRTALDHLKSTGELTVTATSKFRVITVNNYSQYQDIDKQDDRQATSERQASDKQSTTIEEGKERKNNNNNKSGVRFAPPSIDDVRAYCDEKGYHIDAERFVDYYTSNGWMVGKNKMKDWKAAVRNWTKSGRKEKAAEPGKEVTDGFKLWN